MRQYKLNLLEIAFCIKYPIVWVYISASNNYFYMKVACMPLFSHAMNNSEKNIEMTAF